MKTYNFKEALKFIREGKSVRLSDWPENKFIKMDSVTKLWDGLEFVNKENISVYESLNDESPKQYIPHLAEIEAENWIAL